MTITYTIPGATLIDQLHEATSDGQPDENADDNCVSASLAEGLHIETGRSFNGDELKDAVYGQGWTGFQAAWKYVGYCADEGVTLAAHNGSQADLVATIRAQVAAGHPVIVTMPSEWNTAPADPVHPAGTTHVGIAVGLGPDVIRVMNPWHGWFQDQSDAWWQARLCEGQVWVMTRKTGTAMTTVPTGWTDNGKVLTAPNGVKVDTGFRLKILEGNWDPANLPLAPAFDVPEVEIANPEHGPGQILYCTYSALFWTPKENAVVRSWVGREAMTMRAQITTLEAQAARDAAALASQSAQVAMLEAQVKSLTAQLATAVAAKPAAPVTPPAPSTPADAAALLVRLIYAQAEATLKAVS